MMDLKSAHKCYMSVPTVLKMGDIPRQTWKMGRTTELFPGRDGLIRYCNVLTTTGSLLKRPVQLIN